MTEVLKQNLTQLLGTYSRQVDDDIERWLVAEGTPPTLADAMRYCVLGGGKRLRPALVLMSCQAVGGDANDELARRCAVAVEMIHCYSLVHDDLPAMDDDTLRRGRPTAHVKFGEAMAILAGDALLTRSFAVLAGGARDANAQRAAQAVAELAQGAGEVGMIAGQVADMDLCPVAEGLEGLRYIHSRKTGALIRASVRMGAICGQASPAVLEELSRFGENLGLAFQMVDDLLDATGQAATLGKTPGKDAASGKRTYVSLLGLEAAGAMAKEITAAAVESLTSLGAGAASLRQLAVLLTERTH